MNLLFVFIIVLVNLGISYWNAKCVGWSWVEMKHRGFSWPWVITRAGWLMSALGFTWSYLIILVFAGIAFGKLTTEEAEIALQLGYLLVVPGVLFAGFLIMVDSWARAYRQRTLANTAVAGWNTFANVYNYYNAIRSVPDVLDNVLDFFGKGSSKGKSQAIVLLLVIVAALSGFITTWYIVSTTAAADEPMPARPSYA